MNILIVTGIEGARNCAAVVGAQLGMEVEVAEGRKAALGALRRREFAAVVVDETMAECDPSAAEAIWDRAGLAIPLQINFALSGAARLTREIRAALHRREREQALARRAAAAMIESELKTTVAGLLLHSQLALSGSEAASPIADKLRVVADLAGSLRQQLNAPFEIRGNTAACAPAGTGRPGGRLRLLPRQTGVPGARTLCAGVETRGPRRTNFVRWGGDKRRGRKSSLPACAEESAKKFIALHPPRRTAADRGGICPGVFSRPIQIVARIRQLANLLSPRTCPQWRGGGQLAAFVKDSSKKRPSRSSSSARIAASSYGQRGTGPEAPKSPVPHPSLFSSEGWETETVRSPRRRPPAWTARPPTAGGG